MHSAPAALDRLKASIAAAQAQVGIYGLGYVGLPLALRFADAGLKVIGFDIDAVKVEKLNAGSTYIERLTPDLIQKARAQGFEATSDFTRTRACDALIICVPTPLDRHRNPDLGFITATMDEIQPHLRAGQLLSLESTTKTLGSRKHWGQVLQSNNNLLCRFTARLTVA